jgi:ABC-type nitrate/sulfonate/bicarbonate transport system substrate-binding protein
VKPHRMRNSRAPIRIAVTVAAMTLMAAACGNSPDPPSGSTTGKTRSLTILETTPGFFDVPIYAMMHDGYAAKNHLKLTIRQFFSGSASSSQIFASGTGDILFGGITAPVDLAQKAHAKVTVFGDLMQRPIFDLVTPTGSGIRSLTDLPGKTVGISGPGSFNDIDLRYELNLAGVDPSKVKIAALGGTATQYAALLSKKADAVQLQAPTLEKALRDKSAQSVFDFRKDLQPALVFTARTSDMQSDATPFRNFINAYAQVLQKMKSDSGYATDVATRAYGGSTSPADLQTELKEYLGSPGIWSLNGSFTQLLYDNGKALLVKSGQYQEAGFPTYAQLTTGFPAGS